MKILVLGAGVLGCNLARNLFRAGKDVTLLARGTWAEQIKENGLRIKERNEKVKVDCSVYLSLIIIFIFTSLFRIMFFISRHPTLISFFLPC